MTDFTPIQNALKGVLTDVITLKSTLDPLADMADWEQADRVETTTLTALKLTEKPKSNP